MGRFWRRHKKTVINGAIFLAMVGVIVIFERISAAKMEETPTETIESADQTEVSVDTQEETSLQTLPLTVSAASLSDGEILTLGENCIKKNKELTFEANVEEMGILIFRHGERSYGAAWMTLDNEKVEVYTCGNETTRQLSEEHGLNLSGAMRVHMDVGADETMTLTITADGETFRSRGITWTGCRGAIEVESIGNEMTDVQATWNTPDIEKEIWVLGDSYLGSRWKNRWPYYVTEAGYDSMLYSGYPGANSQTMYKEWENLLTYGTPKYAVWCLSINDGDSSSGINMTWKAKLQLFLADCDELGVTPILVTIPSTPTVNNTYKNEYIRNSGYRYIDFAMAVGGNKKNSLWLEGMLATDQMHPTNAGAEALAERVLKDFPEIMGKETE